MTARDFTYWLQGFFEVTNVVAVNADQVKMIRQHLDTVFKAETEAAKERATTTSALDVFVARHGLPGIQLC